MEIFLGYASVRCVVEELIHSRHDIGPFGCIERISVDFVDRVEIAVIHESAACPGRIQRSPGIFLIFRSIRSITITGNPVFAQAYHRTYIV